MTIDDAIREVAEDSYDPNIIDVFVRYFRDRGISYDVIDLIFNYELIRLIACGLSNKSIADSFDIPVETVWQICRRFYNGFDGWEEDLNYNPLYLDGKLTKEVQEIVNNFKVHKAILEEVYE